MLERRKFRRRHLIYYPRVYDRASGELLGHLADLTTAGIMLLRKHPLPIGQTYACRMVLPGDGDTHDEVTFDAHSVWCQRDVNPAYYAAGFRLERPDARTVEAIERIIADHGFRD